VSKVSKVTLEMGLFFVRSFVVVQSFVLIVADYSTWSLTIRRQLDSDADYSLTIMGPFRSLVRAARPLVWW
jgi:hypothetical protein